MAKKQNAIEFDGPTGTTIKIVGCKSLGKVKYFRIIYGSASGYVPQELFVMQKHEARKRLQKQHVVITSDKDWSAIVQAIEAVRLFKRAPLLERPGWTGRYFADRIGRAFSPPAAPPGIPVFEPVGTGASSKGNWTAWAEQVAVPLTGQIIPMIAIMAAFAAPLLRLTGELYNFGFEFCGPPATGKTSCIALMASVGGNPAHIATFNATLAGLEGMFIEHQDRAFPIDEANLADARNPNFFKELAFRLANGSIKVSAVQPDRAQYRFIFATTANLPFPETLKGFDLDTAGAALQRLFPLRISNENPLGVFDFLPEGFPDSGALATHLQSAIGRNYGTALPHFLQGLVDRRAEDAAGLRKAIARHIRQFEVTVGVAETARGKSRASSAFGLLYAAGCLAKTMTILPEGWDCLAACVAGYRNYQSLLPEQTPLITRLLTLAQRPETLDLRRGKLPKLSDEDMARHGAFLRLGTRKRVELLIWPERKAEFFRDWAKLSATADFKDMNRRDREHITKQREVRRGRKAERFITFVLPPGFTV